jgi:glycosyltransferase involved in cell wall biosynthesis
MHTFDIMVVPSLRESQTRVVPQAFACGRPIIAYATGGVPELIEEGVTGWLSPTGDVDHLAGRILAVASDLTKAAAVGETARRHAHADMRLERKMEQTIDAYERAIERAGSDRFVRPLSLSASPSLAGRLSLPTSWPAFWPPKLRKSAL